VDDPHADPTEREAARHLGRVRALRARAESSRALVEQRLARSESPAVRIAMAAVASDRRFAGGLLAGGLAYRFFLWLLPASLSAAVVFGWLGSGRQVKGDAREFGLGAVAADAVAQGVRESRHDGIWLFLTGIVLMLYFSYGAVKALRLVHAVAWEVPSTPKPNPVRAGLAFSGVTIALLVATSLEARARTADASGGLVLTLAFALAWPFALAIWAGRLMPHRPVAWTAFVPGAVLIAIGSVGLHVFTVYYLVGRLGHYRQLYGALGSAVVLLLWLFVIARLIVASAFLDAALAARGEEDTG